MKESFHCWPAANRSAATLAKETKDSITPYSTATINTDGKNHFHQEQRKFMSPFLRQIRYYLEVEHSIFVQSIIYQVHQNASLVSSRVRPLSIVSYSEMFGLSSQQPKQFQHGWCLKQYRVFTTM